MRVSFLLLFSFFSLNVSTQQVLKPQEAFPIEVAFQNDVLQISHRIKDGYYLYRDKISYETQDTRILLGSAKLPEGIKYEDEFFGKTQILRGKLFISTAKVENLNNLLIYFQGCSDSGFCYPLQSQKISQIIF